MSFLFPMIYESSRAKFRDAVSRAGAELIVMEHPTETGNSGDGLSIDVAVFGAQEGRKVLFNVNGTHGNESYAGGAAQLQLIDVGAAQ